MTNTTVSGFNHNNFQRGWALLHENGTVQNVCANCDSFEMCNASYNGKPCDNQKMLEKEKHPSGKAYI